MTTGRERFHNRVLDWVPAQPASLADAKHLRALYCKRVKPRQRRLRALLGWVLVWSGLFGFAAVLIAVHRARVPEPTTTHVTLRLGQAVLECSLYEDRANHTKSLSC